MKSEQSLRNAVQRDVNKFLNSYFKQQIKKSSQLDLQYAKLWETIHAATTAGGKRLRPYLTVLSYQAFGGKDYEALLPIAAAQELLHQGLLIHDDIIDRDYIRYGQPNVAGLYQEHYRLVAGDTPHANHYANSAALLAGDLVLFAIFHVINSSSLTPVMKLKLQAIMHEAMFSVVSGELLDAEAALHSPESIDVQKIAVQKTASYSCVAPLLSGAVVAGVGADQQQLLRSYGEHLGIAYQLVNDLQGLFGKEAQTGKSEKGDIAEGKRTFMLQYAYQHAGENVIVLDSLVGKIDITDAEADEARRIIRDSGAEQATQKLIKRHVKKAQVVAERLAVAKDMKTEFIKLAETATGRVY